MHSNLLEIFVEDSRLVITSLGRYPIRKTPLLAFKSAKRTASRRKLPFHGIRPFFASPGARPARTDPDSQGHGSARTRTAWPDPESTTETIECDSSEVRAVPQTVEAGLREGVAPPRLETRLGKSRDVVGGALRPHESARRSTGERSMALKPAAKLDNRIAHFWQGRRPITARTKVQGSSPRPRYSIHHGCSCKCRASTPVPSFCRST
jgi:hypothetical protein